MFSSRSWGADWGEDGYYRLLRGDNTCGIANMVVHSVVKDPRGEGTEQTARTDDGGDSTPDAGSSNGAQP